MQTAAPTSISKCSLLCGRSARCKRGKRKAATRLTSLNGKEASTLRACTQFAPWMERSLASCSSFPPTALKIALGDLLAAIGNRVTTVFMLVSDCREGGHLASYMCRHRIEVETSLFDNPGLDFADTSGTTAGRTHTLM